jgi:uncharacterized protein (TIGR02680 family)
MKQGLASAEAVVASAERFRLGRAGVLNVWQYDEQVFEFADGRLLLRGANGAGKSKTLEMLLPFVLDGDKNRMTASGKHHTSLLWLMTDGYDGQSRVGYLWVEFERETGHGATETLTCGVGVRASQSARTAACWFFTTPRRFGADLLLEDDAGPLPKERCRDAIGPDGHLFDSPRQYKEHVGRTLFGLDVNRYDELLRLLYWLRQPQVGEDIEPARLASILSVALPELDESSLRTAGDTFDELAAFGEQIERQQKAAEAMAAFAAVYAGYSRTVAQSRGQALTGADREQKRRVVEVVKAQRAVTEIANSMTQAESRMTEAEKGKAVAEARLRQLEASPEALSEQRLLSLNEVATAAEEHADRAEREQARTHHRVGATQQRLTLEANQITNQLRQVGSDAHGGPVAASAARLGVTLTVPARIDTPILAHAADADLLVSAISDLVAAIAGARPRIGERLAGVTALESALKESEESDRTAAERERTATAAELRAEQANGRQADAESAAGNAESSFLELLNAWRSHESATHFHIPGDLDAATVATLPMLARQAVAPRLEALKRDEADAGSTRVSTERELTRLRTLRAEIEAERDPSPQPPALPPTSRDHLPGAPLWRLVDFAGSLDSIDAAGLEAALESSALLDAWIRPDGALLDPDRMDVVLTVGSPAATASLAEALVPAVPDAVGVTVATVESVLSRIALVPVGADPTQAEPAAVSADGRWWLGPLVGRAGKPTAQYVGATARAAERLRRLADVDSLRTEADRRRQEAAAAESQARRAIAGIESWLAAFPPDTKLIEAWAHLDAAVAEARRSNAAAQAAQQDAETARSIAAGRRTELHRLAESLDLPPEAAGLASRREELRALDERWQQCARIASTQTTPVGTWQNARRELDGEITQLDELAIEVAELRQRALRARAASDTEQEKVGASVRELQARLASTRDQLSAFGNQATRLSQELRTLGAQHGGAVALVHAAEQRRDEHEPVVVGHARAMADLSDAPGLLAACTFDVSVHRTAIDQARRAELGTRLPPEVIRLAEALASIGNDHVVEEAAVWKGHQDLAAGPAADTEPRIVPIAGMLAALARDDSGEQPVGTLSTRLNAAVARDKELLTDRERRLFEDHILGELGEALRTRRIEAEELVAAMNRLLAEISTSQGIRVTLDWRLRDDVGEDARRAIALLGKPLGALLPDERRELRDAMHRLIEASRAEEPELSYTEHLNRSLDYRQWFAFRIRYTRPETPGKWQDLHRRSALSQGEQKVVCYLPLFAAAAAHYTSVAGAAPHAPRLILLDDAFPKIDMRTHPLLFGLLVDLDLDFVITSERLWGDHATVPSLAIYEALRDPAQRGIAQYRHIWDGHRLHAVGA